MRRDGEIEGGMRKRNVRVRGCVCVCVERRLVVITRKWRKEIKLKQREKKEKVGMKVTA
jgi:hypothetical protein